MFLVGDVLLMSRVFFLFLFLSPTGEMSAEASRLADWLGAGRGRELEGKGTDGGLYCNKRVPGTTPFRQTSLASCRSRVSRALVGKRSKVSFHSNPGRVFPYYQVAPEEVKRSSDKQHRGLSMSCYQPV